MDTTVTASCRIPPKNHAVGSTCWTIRKGYGNGQCSQKAIIMTNISPKKTSEHLDMLESADVTTGAVYREEAQDVLADPGVSLPVKQAIADKLNHANHLLEMRTVIGDDSY